MKSGFRMTHEKSFYIMHLYGNFEFSRDFQRFETAKSELQKSR